MKSSPENSCSRGSGSALKVKLGRPAKTSQMQLPLTDEEKKDKRRMANRDSARRMRARRLENFDHLAQEIHALQEQCRRLEANNNSLTSGRKKLELENQKLNNLVAQLQASKHGKVLQASSTQPAEATSMIQSTSAESSETDGEQLFPLTLLGLQLPAAPLSKAGAKPSACTTGSPLAQTCPDLSATLEGSSMQAFVAAENPHTRTPSPSPPILPSAATSAVPSAATNPQHGHHALMLETALVNMQSSNWSQSGSDNSAAFVSAPPTQQLQRQRGTVLDVSVSSLLDDLHSVPAPNQTQPPTSLSSVQNVQSSADMMLTPPPPLMNTSIPPLAAHNTGMNSFTAPPWHAIGSSGRQSSLIQSALDMMDLLPDLAPEGLNLLGPFDHDPCSPPHIQSSKPFSSGTCMDSAWNLCSESLMHNKAMLQGRLPSLPLMGPSFSTQLLARNHAAPSLGLQSLHASSNGLARFPEDALSSCFATSSTAQDLMFENNRACIGSSWLN